MALGSSHYRRFFLRAGFAIVGGIALLLCSATEQKHHDLVEDPRSPHRDAVERCWLRKSIPILIRPGSRLPPAWRIQRHVSANGLFCSLWKRRPFLLISSRRQPLPHRSSPHISALRARAPRQLSRTLKPAPSYKRYISHPHRFALSIPASWVYPCTAQSHFSDVWRSPSLRPHTGADEPLSNA